MDQFFLTVRPATQADLASLVKLRAYLLDGTAASYSSKTPEDAARWRTAYRTWLSSRLSESDCGRSSPPSTKNPARCWAVRPPSSTSARRRRAASMACPAGCNRWWWSRSGAVAVSPDS